MVLTDLCHCLTHLGESWHGQALLSYSTQLCPVIGHTQLPRLQTQPDIDKSIAVGKREKPFQMLVVFIP